MRTLKKDANDDYQITIAMDASQACRYRLLDSRQLRAILDETAAELAAIGYEMLNLAGDHLLISATPDGELMLDGDGRIQRSISNFEMIRKL